MGLSQIELPAAGAVLWRPERQDARSARLSRRADVSCEPPAPASRRAAHQVPRVQARSARGLCSRRIVLTCHRDFCDAGACFVRADWITSPRAQQPSRDGGSTVGELRRGHAAPLHAGRPRREGQLCTPLRSASSVAHRKLLNRHVHSLPYTTTVKYTMKCKQLRVERCRQHLAALAARRRPKVLPRHSRSHARQAASHLGERAQRGPQHHLRPPQH